MSANRNKSTVQICSVLTNKTSKPSNAGLTNTDSSNTVAFICKCSRNTDAKLFTALTPEASYLPAKWKQQTFKKTLEKVGLSELANLPSMVTIKQLMCAHSMTRSTIIMFPQKGCCSPCSGRTAWPELMQGRNLS